MRPEVDRPIGRGWAAALPPLRRDPHPLDCLRLKNFLAGRFSVESQRRRSVRGFLPRAIKTKGTGEGVLVVGLPQMDLNALCMAQ